MTAMWLCCFDLFASGVLFSCPDFLFVHFVVYMLLFLYVYVFGGSSFGLVLLVLWICPFLCFSVASW